VKVCEFESGMSITSKSRARPKVACEISADRVLAGRISENGNTVEMCSARELAPGSVVPDLTEANVRQPEVVRKTINEVIGAVAGRSRDVIAILPDAAVRVVLLDFDTLPTNALEAESVVRFRLKKSLPFDVDKAKVSYHTQTAQTGLRVVAAVALASVVEDYESAFRDAGYSAGIVLPSMLAALGAADADRPTLVLKVDARTTSLAILDTGQLLLFRTLENTRGVSNWRRKSIRQWCSSRILTTPTLNVFMSPGCRNREARRPPCGPRPEPMCVNWSEARN
jgi:type IV pilus assembly protein PilM